jgi:hypothetical protein
MFGKSNTVSEKQKRISEAAEAISKMAEGTTLTHIVLSEMLEERPRTQAYYSMVRRLKNELMREYAIFLGTEIKVGYRIAESGTEIDIPDSKCKRAVNQFVKAVREMQYINIEIIKDEILKQRTIRIVQDRANVIGLLRLGEPRQIEA